VYVIEVAQIIKQSGHLTYFIVFNFNAFYVHGTVHP